MRYSAATQPIPQLDYLLAAAQEEPVFIDRGQQEIAVLLSMDEFERLSSAANLEFHQFCDKVSDKAESVGLTENKLNDLLLHA